MLSRFIKTRLAAPVVQRRQRSHAQIARNAAVRAPVDSTTLYIKSAMSVRPSAAANVPWLR